MRHFVIFLLPRGHAQKGQSKKHSRCIWKLIEIGNIVFSYVLCRTLWNIIIYILEFWMVFTLFRIINQNKLSLFYTAWLWTLIWSTQQLTVINVIIFQLLWLLRWPKKCLIFKNQNDGSRNNLWQWMCPWTTYIHYINSIKLKQIGAKPQTVL